MPEVKFIVTMALFLGSQLSHSNEKKPYFENNNNFGVWPKYYSQVSSFCV